MSLRTWAEAGAGGSAMTASRANTQARSGTRFERKEGLREEVTLHS
jgi:hypothetical protein